MSNNFYNVETTFWSSYSEYSTLGLCSTKEAMVSWLILETLQKFRCLNPLKGNRLKHQTALYQLV